MTDHSNPQNSKTKRHRSSFSSGFVEDGYERALEGFAAELRSEVEQKYAADLSNSGIIRRWLIRRRIKRELAILVASRAERISDKALF